MRLRLNQDYRNKIANRMRVHLEQENTQEKEKFFKERESFLDKQNATWDLAKECVTRQYPKDDVKMAHYLQDKYPNVNTIAKDSCFHFGYMGEVEERDQHDKPFMAEKYIESHFDFKLDGNINGKESGRQNDFAYAMYRDELKGREGCNPDINIEQKDNQSNPHWTKVDDANEKYLGLNGGEDNQTSFSKEWNNDYVLDLIGREYCRDRQIGCDQKEFAILMTWQQAKQKLIMAHTKWIETILEQCKVLKSGLRDHVYLEQSIDMAKKMGLTISETDILATTSKGIVVSNTDILNHLASLKNKTQTRDQKILARQIYDQQALK